MVLIPIGKRSNPEPFNIELDVSIDTTFLQPKFSPDGNALIFVGYSNPDAYGIARQNFGIVKFIGLEYTYLLSSKREQNINVLTYINKDWLYVSAL